MDSTPNSQVITDLIWETSQYFKNQCNQQCHLQTGECEKPQHLQKNPFSTWRLQWASSISGFMFHLLLVIKGPNKVIFHISLKEC